MLATAHVPCRNRSSLSIVAAIAIAVFALTGCQSSGGNGTQTAGAGANVNTALSPAGRAATRAGATGDVDPGYQRYLVRLAERRQARGLAAPAEMRIAQRRERYKGVFDALSKGAVEVAKEAADPITRRIPFVGKPNDSVTNSVAGLPGQLAHDVDQVTSLATGQLFRKID